MPASGRSLKTALRAAGLRVLVTGLALLLPGCQLLSRSKDDEPARLPPLVASRNVVQLDIVFVDRPKTDALLGDSLWAQVDQIAGLSAESRAMLRENGWRVGHASSNPPRALQELLQLTTDRMEVIDEKRRMIGRRVSLAAGTDVPIEVTELQPELKIERDGELKTYSNARGVLRARMEREQDGWVRIHFLPEIHHGQDILRPVATPFQWTRRREQIVEPLYEQQFAMSLNIGEMAVITTEGTTVDATGAAFFRNVDRNRLLQRLLVVRLANMRRMTPVYND